VDIATVIHAMSKLLPGNWGKVTAGAAVICAILGSISVYTWYADAFSAELEEVQRCNKALELVHEALDTGDASALIESSREGNCVGEKYIDAAKDNVKNAEGILNPMLPPSPAAPLDLFRVLKRVDKALEKDSPGTLPATP